MSLLIEQKIEVYKILIGIVIAIVGGFWTYTTYTQDERRAELTTIIALGDSIAGMNVTCTTEFKALAELASNAKDSAKGKCYSYFQSAYKKTIAAQISIKRPFFYNKDKWSNYWMVLQSKFSLAASSEYNYKDIDIAWQDILKAKGVK